MIDKLVIKGYKSIKEQEIPLGAINVLIGGNGVGKSNFISAFSLIRAIYEGNLAEYVIKKGGANTLLYFGKKYTQEISFDLFFQDAEKNKNRFIVSLATTKESLFVKSIDTAYFAYEKWHYQKHEENKIESEFRNIKKGQAYWVNSLLKEFKVYHFHDTSDTSPIKGFSNVNDNKSLKKDGANIAAFLLHLKQQYPKYFVRIEKTIQLVAPFFDRFVLEPSSQNENLVKLEWKEKGHFDAYFDAYSLSDGTLRFICLATLLMQPLPPKTIIIDEPELGLHPVAINKFASLVRKIAGKSQLIISTQSLNMVDMFEPNDIIVADRKNSDTIFRRLENDNLKNWLEEYSLGDIWGKNIIGGQPFYQ